VGDGKGIFYLTPSYADASEGKPYVPLSFGGRVKERGMEKREASAVECKRLFFHRLWFL
jgi:hypothetical protein